MLNISKCVMKIPQYVLHFVQSTSRLFEYFLHIFVTSSNFAYLFSQPFSFAKVL